MKPCRLRSLVCLAAVRPGRARRAFRRSDLGDGRCNEDQQKLLRTHLVIPVSAGPLTLYYPKWLPGSHRASGPLSGVTGLKFEGNGKTISWKRDLLEHLHPSS